MHRGNVKETDDSEDQGINRRIILKLFLNRKRGGGLELYGLVSEHVAVSCKCGNESSVSTNNGGFPDQVRNH